MLSEEGKELISANHRSLENSSSHLGLHGLRLLNLKCSVLFLLYFHYCTDFCLSNFQTTQELSKWCPELQYLLIQVLDSQKPCLNLENKNFSLSSISLSIRHSLMKCALLVDLPDNNPLFFSVSGYLIRPAST